MRVLLVYFTVFTLFLSLSCTLKRERHVNQRGNVDQRQNLRNERSTSAFCADRPDGCFCEDKDNSCNSCTTEDGCCMCDEYCVTAGDCCLDFTTTCGDLCSPLQIDLVFVLDSSRSVGKQYFNIMKNYLRSLYQNLTVDENFQTAIISFSEDAFVEFDFNTISNKDDFDQKLSTLAFRGGKSEIHLGLRRARELLYERHRLNRKKIIVILTDGLPSTPSKIQTTFYNDIIIYAVAIGEDVSHFFLKMITSTMSRVSPTNIDKLSHNLFSERYNPKCNLHTCNSSSEADIILAVDISPDMQSKDMTSTVPDILITILEELIKRTNESQLSLVTFHQNIDVIMNFTQVSPKSKRRLKLTLSSLYQSEEKHSNFSRLISFSEILAHDSTRGSKQTAQKILMIISRFSGYNDDEFSSLTREVTTNNLEIFTIGLNEEDHTFEAMRALTPTSFHVGILGKTPECKVEYFIDAFIEHLVRLKCT